MVGPATLGDLMPVVPQPMLVLTTAAGDERAGCLVGFHSQSSIEPPQYAVWVSKANRTFRIGVLADRFALHFLEAHNVQLAELFGGTTGDDEDKFAQCAWHAGADGTPLLDDCAARFTAHRVAMHDPGGDHVCFVLEPELVETPDTFTPLEPGGLGDLVAGHAPTERQKPR
jgi:flavin reductase (DIM6/NTAB) family NADH-FMN oxidoreductase RutF